MKKVFAVVLVLALMLTLSVTAFAAKSPGGTEYDNVIVNRTSSGQSSKKPEVIIIVKGKNVELVPTESEDLVFNGWNFYLDQKATKKAIATKDFDIIDVKTEEGKDAVKDVDYEVIDGQVVSKNGDLIVVVIKPNTDLYVSENYEGVEIVFNIESPITSDNSYNAMLIVLFGILVMGAAVVTVKAGKRAF